MKEIAIGIEEKTEGSKVRGLRNCAVKQFHHPRKKAVRTVDAKEVAVENRAEETCYRSNN